MSSRGGSVRLAACLSVSLLICLLLRLLICLSVCLNAYISGTINAIATKFVDNTRIILLYLEVCCRIWTRPFFVPNNQ